jgi:hypothetical protein
MSTFFNNKQLPPTEEILLSVMGGAKILLDEVIRFVETEFSECRTEWKFYGIKIGWSLKVIHKKRNILFVGPEAGYFRVAFAFGEKAYRKILESDLPEYIKNQLAGATVYLEGRPLRLEIRTAGDTQLLHRLIKIKLEN